MTVIVLVVCIILSVGSLAWGYGQAGFLTLSQGLLFFGLVWLYSQRRGWKWFSSVGLFTVILFAGVGLWIEVASGWMIASAIFSVFAWDMAEFRSRLQFVAMDDDLRGLERRHIARVTLVVLAGISLVTISLLINLQFTFEWGVLLVAVALLGIGQVVAWFRRQ